MFDFKACSLRTKKKRTCISESFTDLKTGLFQNLILRCQLVSTPLHF